MARQRSRRCSALNLWQKVEPRVVYGMNVSQVKQFVSSGNAEVGFLPRSLVQDGQGTYLEVDEKLHQPIDQAIGVVHASTRQDEARRFMEFVLGPRRTRDSAEARLSIRNLKLRLTVASTRSENQTRRKGHGNRQLSQPGTKCFLGLSSRFPARFGRRALEEVPAKIS